MLVDFSHEGVPMSAFVLYNFTEVGDTILLLPFITDKEIWEKFFLNYKDGEWKTDSDIKNKYPETFKAIFEKLQDVFNMHRQLIISKVYTKKPPVKTDGRSGYNYCFL